MTRLAAFIPALSFLMVPFFANGSITDYEGTMCVTCNELPAMTEYTMICRDRDVAHQKIEIGVRPARRDKLDWELAFADTVSGKNMRVYAVFTERNKYDFDHEQSINVMVDVDGVNILSRDMGNEIPASNSTVYLAAIFDNEKVDLKIGDNELKEFATIPFTGYVNKCVFSAKNDVTILRCSNLHEPKRMPARIYGSFAEIARLLSLSTDAYCCKWKFMDEEVDPEVALKGGRYQLATLRNQEGGYDIIYLGGANVESWRWETGALKGKLSPTRFTGTYDLEWIDSKGAVINDGSPFATMDGNIMTLEFPLENAKLRFVRAD